MSWILYVFTAVFLFCSVMVGCSGVHLLILAHSIKDSAMGALDLTLALTLLFTVLYQIIREAVAAGIKEARPKQ